MIRNRFSFLLLFLINISLFGQQQITLENIFKEYMFRVEDIEDFHSMNDGNNYTILSDENSIEQYSFATGEKIETVFSLKQSEIEGVSGISEYEFSSDESKILLTTDKYYIYRYSFISAYYVFDIKSEKIIPVFDKKQQFAKLSPDGKKVAFIVGNNLYIKDLITLETTKVTFDGKHGTVINGMPDWVYEEEFALTCGFEWSPDSKYIAFFRFDESGVREYQLESYEGLYPDWYSYKYPKAGEENSDVNIMVFDLSTGKIIQMATGDNTDVYFPRIKWTTVPDKLCVIRLNRLQNKADLLLCEASSGNASIIYTEEDEKFITQFTDDFANFLGDGKHLIMMSERNGFMHFYRYTYQGELVNQITKGKWEVDKLLGIDEKNKEIYYTSTEESPLERQVYVIKTDGSGKKKISAEQGYNYAEFSKTFEFYVLRHSSANDPTEISLYDKNGKLLRILEDNADLKKNKETFNFTNREFFDFTGPSGDKLYGYMYKPLNFDKNKKYPVFMFVYGGPDSQEVTDSWDRGQAWYQMLTQQGYIVACVDNRGTNGRGAEFKKSTYMQLGKYETEDQVAAAEYLASLTYIDRNRIGIFGWSYGGYMSLLCLMKGNGIFKMGIAVAPVTNWRFYDSIYTERFMRKPQDNPEGYDNNSPLNFTEGLKGKLLLIHGTADDNVHFQNSMMLTEQLVQNNKQFEMQFYPNKNHGIYGGNTRYHLYMRMTQFVFDNL